MKMDEVTYASHSLEQFLRELSAGTAAPAGGCVTALVGALSSALIEMVANLTVDRPRYAAVNEEMKMVRTEISLLREDLVNFIDQDAKFYQQVIDAYKLPKETPEQIELRKGEVERALYNAALVPLNVARKCLEAFALVEVVIRRGNPNASADALVAAVLLRSAIYGAIINVRENIHNILESPLVFELSSEIQDIMLRADEFERRAMQLKQKEKK